MNPSQGDNTVPHAPKVSVIIPAYNDAAGVERCLQALAQMQWPHARLQVIVVDNGSQPPLTVQTQTPFVLRLLRCDKPGSYAARNVGVASATGTVLAFTDADCQPDQQWLARGVAALKAAAGQGLVAGEVELECPERPTATALYQCITGFGQARNVKQRGFAATANLLCLRQQFEQVGPFDEQLLSGGDLEWCGRAARHGFKVVYEPAAKVRTRPRTQLRGAIRQARRVAAGRAMLQRQPAGYLPQPAIGKQRNAWQSARWILQHPQLRRRDRLRVLAAALTIRTASAMERVRLALGGRAERR